MLDIQNQTITVSATRSTSSLQGRCNRLVGETKRTDRSTFCRSSSRWKPSNQNGLNCLKTLCLRSRSDIRTFCGSKTLTLNGIRRPLFRTCASKSVDCPTVLRHLEGGTLDPKSEHAT